jgi:hypothetical protein
VFWVDATDLWYIEVTGVYHTSSEDVASAELVETWSDGDPTVRLDAASQHATDTEVGGTRKRRLFALDYL